MTNRPILTIQIALNAYAKGKIIYADMAFGVTIETFDLEMLPKSLETSQL
jgi:hypothetical protein